MSRSLFILVSDSHEEVDSAKKFCETQGVTLQVYTSGQWRDGLENSQFRQTINGGFPSLVSGSLPVKPGNYASNVVPFPTPTQTQVSVTKIEDLEQQAIVNAIRQYNGNLTEAAKALGIGRATLYRRVKYFKIDPNQSRKKRAA